MKKAKILLVGDSINLGYRNIVKNNLNDWAKVFFPKEQGKIASDVYRILNEYMRVDEEVALVYWNAGLSDAARVYGDELQTPIDIYTDYLERIAVRLKKLYPNAKIVFASATPVLERLCESNIYLSNHDIDIYNKAAYEVLKSKIDIYDDLYELMHEAEEDFFDDAIHFNAKGNYKLADHISGLISASLPELKASYIESMSVLEEKKKALLDDIYNGKAKPAVYAWGAGNIFREYKELVQRYCDIKSVIDRDKRIQGSIVEGYTCICPDKLVEENAIVIVMIDNTDAQRDILEYCYDKGILCYTYQEYLDIMWDKYEKEILKDNNVILTDYDPNAEEVMKKYIGLIIPENLCNLDCCYCYLSISSNRRFENIGRKNPHVPQYIRYQLRREVLGGSCLIGFTGSGETLLADNFCDVCTELLKEGHYLHIVTNGTPVNKIKEILESAGQYQKHIIFKLSFHYLQLLEKNLLSKFVESVRLIEESEASYTIEVMPHDELIPYISEVLAFSKEHFGAYPQLTIGRNELDKTKLLTNQSYKEYIETWKPFESEMFDMRMNLYMTKGKNCGAGPLGFFVDMYSGKVQHCVYNENLGNIYIDGLKNIDLSRVGDTCPLEYCYNCHVYATFGILPKDGVPTYMEIRDRVKDDGTHWLKDDMRRFLDIKLQ